MLLSPERQRRQICEPASSHTESRTRPSWIFSNSHGRQLGRDLLQLRLERLELAELSLDVLLRSSRGGGLPAPDLQPSHDLALHLDLFLQPGLLGRPGHSRFERLGLELGRLLGLLRLLPRQLRLLGGRAGDGGLGGVGATKLGPPLVDVGRINLAKEVARRADLVSGEEDDLELVGDAPGRRVELLDDLVRRRRHEGMHEGREEVDEVDGREDDLGAPRRVRDEERVVDAVVLDELVPARRELHERREGASDLLVVHVGDIGREEGVDVGDEGGVLRGERARGRRERVVDGAGGRVREDRGVLGVDELEHAVAEVSKVVEELRVVARDKVVPGELGVARLGAVLEEVVPPDGRGDAGRPCVLTKDSDVLGLGELGSLVLEVFCGKMGPQRRSWASGKDGTDRSC